MCKNKDTEICMLCGDCGTNTYQEDSRLEIPFEDISEVKLDETMVSNLHEFNNCGSFDLTVRGIVYYVKFNHGTIETNFPDSELVRSFWYEGGK